MSNAYGVEWSFCQVVDITGWIWRRISEDLDNCEAYFLSGLTDQDVSEGVFWNGPCVEVFRIYESPVFSLGNCQPTRYWGVTVYPCSPLAEEELGDTKDERYNSLEEAMRTAEVLLANASWDADD